MKYIIYCFLLAGVLHASKTSSQTEFQFHPIVQRAKETSLYADKVNWNKLNKQFIESTDQSGDLKEGLELLINSLGDKHATFRSTEDYSIIANYTGKRSANDNRKSDFVNEVINDINAKFEFKLLDGQIGYLKIVGIAPGAIAENAQIIRDGLKALNDQRVDRWIVDLRYNGGGDINPMIAGLAPLIGDGFIGGSVNGENKIHQEYHIKNGRFYDNGSLVTEIDEMPSMNPNQRVAVLLSRYTISSGEMLAIAFKGRKNTRFFGEETAGYTTGNGWQQVGDGLIMNISESVFIDRNHVVYDQRVGVDEPIEFGHMVDDANSKQILKAKDWLMN